MRRPSSFQAKVLAVFCGVVVTSSGVGCSSSEGAAPGGSSGAPMASAGAGPVGGEPGQTAGATGSPHGGSSNSAGADLGGASTGGVALGGGGVAGANQGGLTLGGMQAGGSAGSAASGSGGASNGECTRTLLDGLVDAYLAALSARTPTGLPLAENLKFTENAQVAQLGTTTFWKNAGDVKYSQRALDTQTCSAAVQAVIPESGTDLPVALRLKAQGGQLTEIETIVVRPGDYTASFAVDSNPAAIIAIADDIGWHDEVAPAERATRQQLTSWIDKYFRAFPSGVCNVTSDCRRLENGGGNFSCGSGASCSAATPTSGGTFEPRVIVVDELRGIAAGFTIFDFQTTGHLDMHMIKMSGGQVHAVHAILRNTDGKSGWE